MIKQFDILGLGCVSVDDFLFVPAFPAADEKTRVTSTDRQCGGLTGTALVAAARLGAKCVYGGVLGDDELSKYVEANFTREGIDTHHIARHDGARPIHSVIVVAADTKTRNIFFDLAGRTGAADESPDEEVIRASRVLLIDHYGIEGNLRACKIARDAGVPIVADFESSNVPRFAELLELVDHLVLAEPFALKITGCADAWTAAAKLWTANRTAVVITCGARGSWRMGENDSSPKHLPAYKVKVVDTTGCGDVFHGAYCASLAIGAKLEERVKFASAAAALKASQPGGQRGIASVEQVRTFLKTAKPLEIV